MKMKHCFALIFHYLHCRVIHLCVSIHSTEIQLNKSSLSMCAQYCATTFLHRHLTYHSWQPCKVVIIGFNLQIKNFGSELFRNLPRVRHLVRGMAKFQSRYLDSKTQISFLLFPYHKDNSLAISKLPKKNLFNREFQRRKKRSFDFNNCSWNLERLSKVNLLSIGVIGTC